MTLPVRNPRPTRRTFTQHRLAGRRRAATAAGSLGEQIGRARKRRRWTQDQLAGKVGISQAHQSQIERGRGAGVPLEVWFALSEALDVQLRLEFGRDRLDEPADAGHLQLQEMVLRLARAAGYAGTFELPTRPTHPTLSVDIGLRDDRRRLLVLVECWNTFGNIGASVRNTRRKQAEAEALAVAVGGERGPYRVATCWVVRDSRRNREILARYPETFGSTFTGSSVGWLSALAHRGAMPPDAIGLVWGEIRGARLAAWRRAGG